MSFLLLWLEFSYAARDWEYWSGYTLTKRLNEKIDFNILPEFRMKDDMGDFYTFVLYVGPNFKIHKHFDGSLWYKLVSSKKNKEWSESHRMDVDGTFKTEICNFGFSNRCRFEHNFTASGWLYRNRFKLDAPVRFFNTKFKFYIQDETFSALEPDDGFNENRASVGLSFDFIAGTKLEPYFMLRRKKSGGNWVTTNVFGSFLKFSF